MSDVSQDNRTMGMLAHLSALITIGPLIFWLISKDSPEKSFVTNNAREALNFVITIWIAVIGMVVLGIILAFIPVIGWIIGILLWLVWLVVGLGALVLVIMAAVKANGGEEYRYPFAIRLIN
ncbi:MAG TPA: DUF4870 domain-containing protein [Arenimonas sp.]|nr:DUF4870 domain-containing protein [Arenimonas sp.]